MYFLRRFLLLIPTLFIVTVVVFLLIRIAPGDPAVLIAGDAQDPALLEKIRTDLGLNDPIWMQYWSWLGQVLTLQLGASLVSGADVSELIITRWFVTIQIVTLATALSAVIAVPAGILTAWKQGTAFDGAVVFTSILVLSIPSFWLAIIFILIFGVELQLLPTVGYVPPSQGVLRSMSYILLPVLALAMVQAGTVLRLTRAAAIDVIGAEYVTFARSKGISDGKVLRRHVFPNAFPPVLTIISLIFGVLLAGAAVTETVFTLPGLGRLLVDSISARDYPVVQGAVLFIAIQYIFINLVTDLLYPLFDPKVRLE